MNVRLLILMAFWLPLASLLGQQEQQRPSSHYRIVNQAPRGITIEFEFENPRIEAVSGQNQSIFNFEIPGLDNNHIADLPILPVLALPLTLPETKLTAHLTVIESQRFAGNFPATFRETPVASFSARDQQLAAAADNRIEKNIIDKQPVRAFRSTYPQQIYDIQEQGLFRDVKISSLMIHPLQVTPSGTVFYKKFILEIRFSRSMPALHAVPSEERRLLRQFVANPAQLDLVANQPAPLEKSGGNQPPMSMQGSTRLRLVVAEDGIYQVTGADLEAAGINLADIDVQSIRLDNKGVDVSFYLLGDRDNIFDREDYLEFWGERNDQTLIDQYPDQYTDPFSDENVYWLSWGGSPGVRMVDENGSLITNRTGEFNPSFFFTSTIHVERNNYFERLGQGNLNRLSHTRDQWFFNSGIRAVGKVQVPFDLIHPDPSSFNNVEVTVMLSGKSFGAQFNGRSVPHDVMIWLNNGFVGESSQDWFDQDTSRITNINNSTIRNSSLNHGQNFLEVQLPRLPDVTQFITDPDGTVRTVVVKGTDIVLLNWFDVTYDRQYIASDNAIEFRRPSFIPYPGTDLFQFDLKRFARPEIEIYKKGISRIVNFRTDREVEGGQTIYNISFQDNVSSDDVEYIAISADLKKKPLRIEIDQPFDPEAPQRRLKDRNNAADYLIITHDQFYQTAQPLLQHRRNQGLVAELVTVQNIYDEFNFGIKSPLAIQEFLRYAFFNWRRSPRLKYVVLLGDANFDYKQNTGVNQDYVPTFFYQTEEFGASATDYPYTLVAGNDQIPDLFIGRIPATSNSDVNNVVAKLIDYDQNTLVNTWRNQSLFISGNDVRTFELNTQNPAFRSQNSRIIEGVLPRNASAKRLHTVRDTSLTFDPNFGNDVDLIDDWEEGLFWINFMGHGGGGIWADVKLMGLSDVDRLNNRSMYPFVTSMTCFTGAFENPNQLGLAQKLLLAPDRGAIGVFASSGLGYLHNDYTMLWNIGQLMFEEDRNLGEIIMLGKILYRLNGGRYIGNFGTPGFNAVKNAMTYQYNFFGDPVTKLKFTQNNLDFSLNTATPQRGDTVQVVINSNFATADGYLELADQEFNIIEREPLFAVSPGRQEQIVVPPDFPEGTGVLRVYLSDGVSDQGGQAGIGVNFAALSELNLIPAVPGVDDTVSVEMTVFDGAGIRSVYLLLQGNVDTLYAQAQPDSGKFIARIPPAGRLTTVFYDIFVENTAGNISEFRNRRFVVSDIRPDLSIIPGSLRFVGRQQTQIKLGIENTAGAGADGEILAEVRFYDGIRNFENQTHFAVGEALLNASDSASVAVNFPASPGVDSYHIFARVAVNSNEDVQDFNGNNNQTDQVLIPTIFNVSPNSEQFISIDSVFQVRFPAGSVSDSTAVRIQRNTFPAPKDQLGLVPVSLLESGRFDGINIEILNPDADIHQPFSLVVKIDSVLAGDISSLEEIVLYEKTGQNRPWIATDAIGDPVDYVIPANLQKGALYAPFLNGDSRAPRIELSADGRPLKEEGSGLVARNPTLHLIIEDEGGVNLDRDKIEILLNGAELPPENISIPDTVQQNNNLGITLFPELLDGTHRLEVQAQDVNGNFKRANFQLQVSAEFDIRVYGNYPNPFTDQTIFSYFVDLNDDLDEFEIRIYTVSGRMIRRIDSDINNPLDAVDGGARRKGYNELIWDGTDRNGNDIANGLYFAVVRGTYQGETIERILKVAKLR